eukprot:s472_g15.t1
MSTVDCCKFRLPVLQVNLVDFDVEAVDELAVAAGTARADLVGKGPELLVLGLRCSRTGCCRLPFTVQKGDLLSRADDTVALCLAQMASAVLRRGFIWITEFEKN